MADVVIDHPELARWLLEQGIDSLSLNPDTVVETWMFLATPANTKPHKEVQPPA